MPSPSHEERICAMFDSFVKTVARNCVRNLQRDEANRSRHIADEPVEYLLELLGREDDYPSDSYVLYVDEGISAMNTKKRDGFNQMVADTMRRGYS